MILHFLDTKTDVSLLFLFSTWRSEVWYGILQVVREIHLDIEVTDMCLFQAVVLQNQGMRFSKFSSI